MAMMPGEDETVHEFDDAALFALATSAPEPEVKQDTPAEPKDEPQKEPVAEKPATEPARQAQSEQDHMVPLRVMHDERDRRQLAERQLADLQRQMQEMQRPQQRQPVDIFTDPQGFQESLEERFAREQAQAQTRAQRDRFDVSCMIAETKYGDEMHKAFEAFEAVAGAMKGNDRALRERIVNSHNPAETMVQWYRQANTLRETGGDLNAYRDRILKEERDRLSKDPEFRRQVVENLRAEAANRPPVTQMPPSLNRVPAAASNAGEDDREKSDAELFSYAMRRRR